jgi:hypothetical protein
MSPNTLRFLTTLCPYPLNGVTDEQLGDVIDAWLADEFAHEDHRHIHSWNDNESIER